MPGNLKNKISRNIHTIWERLSYQGRVSPLEDNDSGQQSKGGLGLDELHEDFVANAHEKHGKTVLDGFKNNKLSSKATLGAVNINMMTAENNRYFAELGKKPYERVCQGDCVTLDSVKAWIARIDCTDKYGQTVLHEIARGPVARCKHYIDVAGFVIEHHVDVNQVDKFGRTPLHVAAVMDYPEMVNLLIEHGANREANTLNENQTPVHYAAKNDACASLRALVKNECEYKDVRDYKGRTPIHLAAELDRSETARVLLDLGAPVGVSDNSGQKAITWMIIKMAPVAKEALDQFHAIDRANRRQYYRLDMLVQDNGKDSCVPSPLQVITTYHQYELVLHPCMRRLLDIQWMKFGRLGAWIALIFNFVYIIMWTAIATVVNYDERHNYVLPEQWWRIVLFGAAVLLTFYQIIDELVEYIHSRKAHERWKQWRNREIDRDLEYSHPGWPEEQTFLLNEKEELEAAQTKYFSDPWNIFDWIVYLLILASIITHLVDIIAHNDAIARSHIRVMAVTIVLLWLRLMKNARAFTYLGPFIVMLGHMTGDVLRFLFIFSEFYIPFVCAFWMIFGGENKREENKGEDADIVIVDGFVYVTDVFFSLFRLTLVDSYDYVGMKKVDSIMADLLLTAWLALSAILCLNLLIALLSETFQRVYDNAQANAVMQKAITILNVWDGMNEKRKRNFITYINAACAPLRDYYDDDITVSGEEDMKQITLKIKEQLDDLMEKVGEGAGRQGGGTDITNMSNPTGMVTIQRFEKELVSLREGIREIQTVNRNVKEIRRLLQNISGITMPSEKHGIKSATKRVEATGEGEGVLFQRTHRSIPEVSDLPRSQSLPERRDESSGHVKRGNNSRRKAPVSQESGLYIDEDVEQELILSPGELSSSTPTMELTQLYFGDQVPDLPNYGDIDPLNARIALPMSMNYTFTPELMPDEQRDNTSQC